jgi:hypothetical protein
MKAELKFTYDTENIDEVREIETMKNGHLYKMILWDVDQKLREQLKYNNSLHDEAYKALEEVRSFLYSCLNDNNINIID